MSFHPLPFSLYIIKFTLCYQLMVFTHWQTLSPLTPLELIWFYLFLGGGDDNCSLSKGWSLSRLVPNGHVSSSNSGGIRMSTLT
jgi:hypothetical protein